MKSITSKELSQIQKFVNDKLRSASKKFGNANTEPFAFISFDNEDPSAYNDQFIIYFSYLQGTGLTPKEEKNLIKQLKREILNEFGISASIVYRLGLTPCDDSNPLTNTIELSEFPPAIIRSALTILVTVAALDQNRIEHEKARIDSFMTSLESKEGTQGPETFNQLFQELLWPHYEDCREIFPSLKAHNFMSIYAIQEYFNITKQDIIEKLVSYIDIIKLFKKDKKHYAIGQYSANPDLLRNFIESRSDDQFLPILKKLRNTHQELLSRISHELEQADLAKGAYHIASTIYAKIRALIEFIDTTPSAESFYQLLGVFWTAKEEDSIRNIKAFDYAKPTNEIEQFFLHVRALNNFCEYAKSALEVIDARIVELKSDKIELLEEAKHKRKEFFKANRELRFNEADVELCSDPPVMPVVTPRPPQENVTQESKQSAQSIASRMESKRLAHEQRRFGLFCLSSNETVAAPLLLSLNIINMQSGESTEVDICPSAARNVNAPLFQLLPNVFVLADHNPCLVLAKPLRQLLHANEGRGYIGAISPGQTGVKYFKNGKDAFVVLKGPTEERVFCSILSLRSVALATTIELIVPTIAVPNHTQYETMLKRPNLAGWLRSTCNNQVVIEETQIADADPAPMTP